MMVEPNPDYYGNKSEFERVTFLYTAEDATVAAARAGQVNMAVVTPATAGNVPEKMQLLAVDSVDNRGIAFPTEPSGKKTESGLAIGNDVTADIAADGRALLIHCLDAPDPDAVRDDIKARYEARLKRIFA